MVRQVLFRSWDINCPPRQTQHRRWRWGFGRCHHRWPAHWTFRASGWVRSRCKGGGGNGWPLTRRQKTGAPPGPPKNTKNTKQNTSEKWTCLFVGVGGGRFVIFWNAWTNWRLKTGWWSVEGGHWRKQWCHWTLVPPDPCRSPQFAIDGAWHFHSVSRQTSRVERIRCSLFLYVGEG